MAGRTGVCVEVAVTQPDLGRSGFSEGAPGEVEEDLLQARRVGLHALHDDVGLGQVGQDRLGEGARTADDGHGTVGPHGGDSLDVGQRPRRRRAEGEAERGLASVGRDEGRDRIEGDEAPVVDDGDPVAQGLGLLHVVGGP
ncbi:MAG: hypothetical protein ACFNLH_01970 [Corynebacterium matruchotii]